VGLEPVSGISEGPVIPVCISREWVPWILGALEVLTVPELWSSDGYVIEVEKLIRDLVGTSYVLCSQVTFTTAECVDFTVDDGGWEEAFPYQAVWSSGLGWEPDDPSNMDRIFIRRHWTGSYNLVRVEVVLSDSIPGDAAAWICPGNTTPACDPYILHASVPSLLVWTGSVTVNDITVGAERGDTDTSAWGRIKSVTLFFNGAGPGIGGSCV